MHCYLYLKKTPQIPIKKTPIKKKQQKLKKITPNKQNKQTSSYRLKSKWKKEV